MGPLGLERCELFHAVVVESAKKASAAQRRDPAKGLGEGVVRRVPGAPGQQGRFAGAKMASVLVRGVVVLVVALAGCGDGGAISKEEFVSTLNAMCEDFSAREQRIGEPQSLADLAEKGPLVADAFDESIAEKIGDLEAPDEIAAQAERLTEIAGQQSDTLHALANAARSNELSKVPQLSEKNGVLNREATAIARELGATSCVEA